MTCHEYRKWMHEYLDGELPPAEKERLFAHIEECPSCKKELHDLQKTIMLLQGHAHVEAPDDFTMRVMSSLPKENKRVRFKRWMKHHPLLVAASLFLILMASSLFSIWNQGPAQMTVSAPNIDQLIIEHDQNLVIVPDDVVVNGDLVIRHGSVEVRGKVTGDVLVTDGGIYLASTANIVGDAEEIDQFMKWAWFHMQRWIKEAIQINP
jgi:anti-sigma factor RsiW